MPYPRYPAKKKLDPRFYEALKAVRAAKFWTDTPNPHQIKVGKYNYYWTTETITIDRGPKVSEKGLDAFIRLLNADPDMKRWRFSVRDAASSPSKREMPKHSSSDEIDDKPVVYDIRKFSYEEPPEEEPFVFRGFIEAPAAANGDHNDRAGDRPF